MDTDRLMTLKEAAAAIGLSLSAFNTHRALLVAAGLKMRRLSMRCIRVQASSINTAIENLPQSWEPAEVRGNRGRRKKEKS